MKTYTSTSIQGTRAGKNKTYQDWLADYFQLQNICSEPAWKMLHSLYLGFTNAVLDSFN